MTTIPFNRVVAFVGPYMSAIAGGIASWLVARVDIAGLPGLDQNNLKTGIAGALTWLLVSRPDVGRALQVARPATRSPWRPTRA